MAYSSQSNPTSQQQPFQRQQQAPQAQQQASPYKAPDMSAYAQPSGGYNAYNVPRTAPKGAQQNDLSGNVPSNQIFAQAYNQASKQYGGNTQAQSFTMPGSFTSQGYNPTTGQYGPMTGGQSFGGNMAYNAINNRPSPVQANATGIGGNPMQWQDAMAQREAFAGNLSQRLNQYAGGQLTGPVTFDQGQLMQQANDQLAKGAFSNPFAQPQMAGNFSQQIPYGDSTFQGYGAQNPDVQRAMGNATQYAQGNFQNPFGNSPQANNPQPSWDQRSYDPSAPQQSDPKSRSPATWSDADLAQVNQSAAADANRQADMGLSDSGVQYYRDPATGKVVSDSQSGRGQDAAANWEATQQWQSRQPARPEIYKSQSAPAAAPARPAPTPSPQPPRAAPNGPGSAQPIEPQSQGTPYNPQAGAQSLPPVPAAATQKPANDPYVFKRPEAFLSPAQGKKETVANAPETPAVWTDQYAQRVAMDKKREAYYEKNPGKRPVQKTPEEKRADFDRRNQEFAQQKQKYDYMVPGTDYDMITGEIKTKLTREQLYDRRWAEQEQNHIRGLYDSGQDTPANIAAAKKHFQELKASGTKPPVPGRREEESADQSLAPPGEQPSPAQYGSHSPDRFRKLPPPGEKPKPQPRMSEERAAVNERAGHGAGRFAPQPKRAPIVAPKNMVIVPPSMRGASARFGGMRRNGG